MTNEFATVTEAVEYFEALGTTLDRDNNTILEDLGKGDGSKNKFLLKREGYIADSLTLYYGSNEDAAIQADQTLTLTTHYTINDNTGLISLTGAGVTLLSTNKLFADYEYNELGYPHNVTQNIVDRSAKWVQDYCETVFTDSTAVTPSWLQVTNEEHYGQGYGQRHYFTDKSPVADVSTLIDGAVTADDAIITVDSTNGFPTSGVLGVGTLKISYTGKTSTTFTGCTGVSANIADNTQLRALVVEASTTPDSTEPVWTVLEYDEDYNIDFNTGRVYLAKDSAYNSSDIVYELAPPKGVPNRFRINYLHGVNNIPLAVKQAVISQAASLFTSQAISKALIRGVDGFSPRANDVLNDDVKKMLAEYKRHNMGRPGN